MKVSIDMEACIGCGLCATDCPGVFENKDDKAIVVANPVPADKEEACKKASENCPTTAIKLE